MKLFPVLASGLFAAQPLLIPAAFAAEDAPVTPVTTTADTPAATTATSPTAGPAKGLHFPPGPPNSRSSSGSRNAGTVKEIPVASYNNANAARLKINEHGGLEGEFTLRSFVYLAESGGTSIADVPMKADAFGTARPTVTNNNGVFLLPIHAMETLSQVQAGSYEVRYLMLRGPSFLNGPNPSSPGPIFQQLWLKSETGGADLVYPLGQNSLLPVQELYLASELVQAFQARYSARDGVQTTPGTAATPAPASVDQTATAPTRALAPAP